MTATMIPFGLTLLESVSARFQPAVLSRAVRNQQRQMAVLTGRPLCEQTVEDLLVGSSPTETDSKNPVAIDTDPGVPLNGVSRAAYPVTLHRVRIYIPRRKKKIPRPTQKTVRLICDHRCACCGSRRRRLELAHIVNFPDTRDDVAQDIPRDLWDSKRELVDTQTWLRFHAIDNIILLCRDCHRAFDSLKRTNPRLYAQRQQEIIRIRADLARRAARSGHYLTHVKRELELAHSTHVLDLNNLIAVQVYLWEAYNSGDVETDSFVIAPLRKKLRRALHFHVSISAGSVRNHCGSADRCERVSATSSRRPAARPGTNETRRVGDHTGQPDQQ